MTFLAAVGIVVLTFLGMFLFPRFLMASFVMVLCYQNDYIYFGNEASFLKSAFIITMASIIFCGIKIDISHMKDSLKELY